MQIRMICTPMGLAISTGHHAPFEHDRDPGQRPVRGGNRDEMLRRVAEMTAAGAR
jgi:hypothetical protein